MKHWDVVDGHWIWRGPYYPTGRPRMARYQSGTASRHRWLEAYGDILPPSTKLERLCSEPKCVRPDHHAIQAPKALWKRLKRPADELEMIRLALDSWRARNTTTLRWENELACPSDEVARIAVRLEVDRLAVLAVWSLLAAPGARLRRVPKMKEPRLDRLAQRIKDELTQGGQGDEA